MSGPSSLIVAGTTTSTTTITNATTNTYTTTTTTITRVSPSTCLELIGAVLSSLPQPLSKGHHYYCY